MKPDERLAEIRRRGQRRLKLRRVVAALVAAAVVVAVGAVTLHQLAPQHGTVVAGRGHTATPASTTQPIPSVAPPAVAVVHLPTTTGQPGPIVVLDIQTGAVLRVLGTVYDPYPDNGFQLSADRRTIYYVHLDEAAQKVETVSVPLGGGTPQVVRVGIRPAPSDDGTLLALLSAAPVSLEVLDPRGGIHHTYALPPASGNNDFVTYAWQRGSWRLLAIDIGLTIDSCSDRPFPPPSSCPSPPTLPTTAWSLDT
jgi:hypothetical protein